MIKLFKRHSVYCEIHKSKLTAKAKRHFEECNCWYWFAGTTSNGAVIPRQSAKTTSRKEAEALVRSLDAAGKDAAVHGPTLEYCIQTYLVSIKSTVKKITRSHISRVLARLQKYAEPKLFIRELDVNLIEEFYENGLTGRDNTKNLAMTKIIPFLKEALRREWIEEPLAEKINAHPAQSRKVVPFTKDEVTKILEAARSRKPGPCVGTNTYPADGERFALLLELQEKTGMRIGDAIRFRPAALMRIERDGKTGWRYRYYPQKGRKAKEARLATVYLYDDLKNAIDGCKSMSKDRPFAYLPVDEENDDEKPGMDVTSYMAQQARELMHKIGDRLGIEDCRPHRLRHTFAVRLLEGGKTINYVSNRLNHASVKITEKYYSFWSQGREDRLEDEFLSAA